MDRKSYVIRIIVVCLLLLATAAAIAYVPLSRSPGEKGGFLSQYLGDVGGWSSFEHAVMSVNIQDSLTTDDSLFTTYRKGNREIDVYIGYYFTSDKIGKPHSPLVCFPGQGWKMSNEKKRTLILGEKDQVPLHVNSIIVQKEQNRQLILFWFQAYDRSCANTFSQKIVALWNRIRYGREDNAFVRVSIACDNKDVETSLSEVSEFLEVFYPAFLRYVKQS
ncbi:MAG: EpsI family protein [Candidatus Aminicenantes bacterium]|nr:EpsI family protein [Candidatus Aminicenantes bacterium]